MKNELEELLKQKKLLDRRIKELSDPNTEVSGILKFEIVENAVCGYKGQVSSITKYTRKKWNSDKREYIEIGINERYAPFIREKTKEDLIKSIDQVINDLANLKEIVKEKEIQ